MYVVCPQTADIRGARVPENYMKNRASRITRLARSRSPIILNNRLKFRIIGPISAVHDLRMRRSRLSDVLRITTGLYGSRATEDEVHVPLANLVVQLFLLRLASRYVQVRN